MTAGDWIQVIAIVISTIISVISIIIAVKTLKQTNQITKEANRAYLVATLEYTALTSIKTIYLVIRNYGNTAATIKNITCSRDVDFFLDLEIFENIVNTSIAPHQSITTVCDFRNNNTPFTLTIEYIQDNDTYTDTYTLSPQAMQNIIYSQTADSNMTTPQAIINGAKELIRSRM